MRPCFFIFPQFSQVQFINQLKIFGISTEFFHIPVIDKTAVFLYNGVVKKNIDRTAILTDLRIHREGMQCVMGIIPADRLGNSVL